MQHKTLSQAVEAIMNNECSIKNDDVACLQRACKYVWPNDAEPDGIHGYYYKLDSKFNSKSWASSNKNPRPHFITATDFCRLMDEDKAEPIDLGKVFDENYKTFAEAGYHFTYMTREKFIEVVSKLLTKNSKAALKP